MKHIPAPVWITTALLAYATLALPTAASAADTEAGTSSFRGTCSATAVVIPYTDFDGTGTCSGTLDGRSVRNVPVHIVATAEGLTLPVAPVLQDGEGTLTFGSGEAISFTFTQVVTGLVIEGTQGGLATGLAIPLPNLTGSETTRAELLAVTVTPLVG